ncbi:hypothetical protein SNE40_021523 [Patella caerulea]|uniref:Uncharacterized protein n=1 Tax=Patella caerulea TaxID=87958 RepID=A0AAN8GIX3_PATCE
MEKKELTYITNQPIHTNTYILIHITPTHQKKAKKVCTIVSNPETKLDRLNELKQYFVKQNYPLKPIQEANRKALEMDSKELRIPKDRRTITNIKKMS